MSVLELVSTLSGVSGSGIEPDVQGDGVPEGEIDRQMLDATAIREELGWQPTFDLSEGLGATWRGMRSASASRRRVQVSALHRQRRV